MNLISTDEVCNVKVKGRWVNWAFILKVVEV